MRALVTGGAGFIGSNLVDRLLADDHEVLVLDDLSTGRRENLPSGARLVEEDVATAAQLAAEAEVVFHLAAQVDVRKSLTDPRHDLAVNAGGTLAVLEGARKSGAKVVLASTGGAIYGEAESIPTPETALERPLSPYGMSKLAAEGYCRLYRDLHGVATTVLRFANVYGPRQDPLGEGGVVAIFCGRALSGEEAMIFGDGRQTRDFVYVGDAVDACLLGAEHDGFGPYNIGTGEETSVLRLADELGAFTEQVLRVRFVDERPGEVRRSCLDPSRAAADLGWKPKSTLTDGLRATMEWSSHQNPGV